jgi:adenosylcobinamide-phosphate synthase
MTALAAAAVTVAAVGDRLTGEPPTRAHPVAWFGRTVAPLDRAYDRPLVTGAIIALTLPLAAAAAVAAVVLAAATLHPWVGAALAGVVLYTTTSLRLLLSAADEVVAAAADDPERARAAAPALVGRDPAALSPAHLRSAAVESAAENLADGLIAPLFAFVVGAQATALLGGTVPETLAVGAAAAAWVKAVNTLDSMLGYPDKRHGTASARLDDAVMWLPARVSAALLAVAGGSPGALARARQHADTPPSPNSGWPMATLAAVLGVGLEKPGAYALFPDRPLPTTEQGQRGVRTVAVAGYLGVVLAGVVAWP